MRGAVSPSTSKCRRRLLTIEEKFERLQAQWKNGQAGAGAWFWRHLKPLLLTVHEESKELHLQCVHCSKLFSALNPSRTSLEHLQSGSCNVFRRTAAYEERKAVPRSPRSGKKGRKASRSKVHSGETTKQARVGDSGGIAAKSNSRGETEASEALANFFLESGTPVSLVTHPRMIEFCASVGLTPPDPRHVLSTFMEARFARAWEHNEARLRKAGLFQIAVEGRGTRRLGVTINFPEGPPTYFKAVDAVAEPGSARASTAALEELDSVVDRRNCVGFVAEIAKEEREAFAEAELRCPWMVHVVCQAFALRALLKDLFKHVKAVAETADMAQRIVQFFKSSPPVSRFSGKFPGVPLVDAATQHPLVRAAMALDSVCRNRAWVEAASRGEAMATSQMGPVAAACMEVHFWECATAVQSLLLPVVATLVDVQRTQPHLSQAMDIWLLLGDRFRDWCARNEGLSSGAMEVFEKRRRKSYHPAMAAAFLLDPGFCARREDGSFGPDWERLGKEKQQDVAVVLKRVSASNRGAKVASEFAEWRSAGLPAEYGRVVCDRKLEGDSCLCKCVPIALRKTIWVSPLKDFEALGMVAHRILAMRATATSSEPFLSVETVPHSAIADLAQTKLQFIRNNARLAEGRLEDERLMDLEILSNAELRCDIDDVVEKGDIEDDSAHKGTERESNHYMQQLQLPAPPLPVLRMSPPPLGTLPELPLPALTSSSPYPAETDPSAEATFYPVSTRQTSGHAMIISPRNGMAANEEEKNDGEL